MLAPPLSGIMESEILSWNIELPEGSPKCQNDSSSLALQIRHQVAHTITLVRAHVLDDYKISIGQLTALAKIHVMGALATLGGDSNTHVYSR